MFFSEIKEPALVKIQSASGFIKAGEVGMAVPYRRSLITAKGSLFCPDEVDVSLIDESEVNWSALRRAVISGRASLNMGSDPEVIMLQGDGTVLPAWTYLPKKTKSVPSVYWDGFQAEFTISPTSCIAWIVDRIRDGLVEVREAALRLDEAARLTHSCVVDVPEHVMNEAEEEYIALGCSPSLNAYGVPPLAVGDPRGLPFRFAGLHIHMGIGYCSPGVALSIVKAADLLVGIPSVSLLAGLEDYRRRDFYGKAGEYRLPEHGVEYRTVSSAGLIHPVAVHVLFELARAACELGSVGISPWEDDEDQVQSIINGLKIDEARSYLRKHKKVFEEILHKSSPGHGDKMLRLITEGITSCMDIESMEENWLLLGDRSWKSHSETLGCNVRTANLRPQTLAEEPIRKAGRPRALKTPTAAPNEELPVLF